MKYAEPILLFYMLAVACEYTFVQELVSIKICANKLEIKDEDQLFKLCEKRTSFKKYENDYLSTMLYYNLFLSLFPLITTTLMGSWNDLFGRRFTMILPVLSSLLVQILLIYSSTEILNQNIIILILLCSFLSGVSGSSSSIISTTHSYLTSHVNKIDLTKRMTILEACIFIGGFLGYNLAAKILQYANPSNKFLYGFSLIAIIHLLIVIYIRFFLTDKDEKTIKFNKLINFRHFLDTFQVLSKSRPNHKRAKLIVLYFCAIASSYALNVQQILLFTYLKTFLWTTENYSKLQGYISLMNGLSLILFFPIIQFLLKKLFKLNNTNTIDGNDNQAFENNQIDYQSRAIDQNIIESNNLNRQTRYNQHAEIVDSKIDLIIVGLGFVSKFLGLGLLSVITNDSFVYFLPPLLMFNEFAMPGVRSMVSKIVDNDEKGKAFGVMAFCRNLCGLTGSFIFKFLYTSTKDFYKGFTFGIVSLIQLLALILINVILVKMNKN